MFAISRCGSGLLAGALLAIMIDVVPCTAASGETHSEVKSQPCLRASKIVDLARSLAFPSGDSDSYPAAVGLLSGNAVPGDQGPDAFEENRFFVYALGSVSPHWVRRLVILKPSTFVVEDQVLPGSEGGDTGACLYSESRPEVTGGRVRIAADGRQLFWETLSPRRSNYRTSPRPSGEPTLGKYELQPIIQGSPSGTRSLNVMYVSGGSGQVSSPPHFELVQAGSQWELTISAGNRVFRLALPAPVDGAGEIAISNVTGKTLMARRPLPLGILPHGLEGNRLLDRWDADYRGQSPPAWDIGRPADELQKIVHEGIIHSCRVVDLGCGSGTDAIFLASHGFDVTAIDISPTALSQAAGKARKARVSVRWVLADVLALPRLESFDFIYDRGCYHNVRDQNLAGYVETVRRLSHAGSKFLLLSARRDEQAAADTPGVTEEELRFDFHSLFDVESLREIRLETNRTNVSPPGWSALMLRNTNP